MKKIFLVLFAIMFLSFLSACNGKEDKSAIPSEISREVLTNSTNEDQEQSAEEPSSSETSTDEDSIVHLQQQYIDMVLAKQILNEADFLASDGDSEYFVPKTDDYMLSLSNQVDDGYTAIVMTSFDENGELCQYIEKRLYENESKLGSVPPGYQITGLAAYKEDELSGYQYMNKIWAIKKASSCIIDRNHSSQEKLEYWDREELLAPRDYYEWMWLSKVEQEPVETAIKDLFSKGF